jgi:quinol monooxygenase YgiN
MFIYKLKIEIKPYKLEEFVKSTRSFSHSIRKEKGCLDLSLYQEFDKENTFIVVGEWKTRHAMEKHFQNQSFELLIGATRVLGQTSVMNICNVLKIEDFKLVMDGLRVKRIDERRLSDREGKP